MFLTHIAILIHQSFISFVSLISTSITHIYFNQGCQFLDLLALWQPSVQLDILIPLCLRVSLNIQLINKKNSNELAQVVRWN